MPAGVWHRASMGCCGSTVDVREVEAPEPMDDESDPGDEGYIASAKMIKLKTEAESMFATVDEGAPPPLDLHVLHPQTIFVADRWERATRSSRGPHASSADGYAVPP